MSQQISIRLQAPHVTQLKHIANERGCAVATLLRDIIENWFAHREKEQLTNIDKTQLKSLSESLYLLRALADRLDPTLKEAARLHAHQAIADIMEQQA